MEKQQSFEAILREKMGVSDHCHEPANMTFDPTLTPSLDNVLPFHQVKKARFHSHTKAKKRYSAWAQYQSQSSNTTQSQHQQEPRATATGATPSQKEKTPEQRPEPTPFKVHSRDLKTTEQQALSMLKDLGSNLASDGFSEEQLTQDFRRLAKALHPDMNLHLSEQERRQKANDFHEMRLCYNELKKAMKRLRPSLESQAA